MRKKSKEFDTAVLIPLKPGGNNQGHCYLLVICILISLIEQVERMTVSWGHKLLLDVTFLYLFIFLSRKCQGIFK